MQWLHCFMIAWMTEMTWLKIAPWLTTNVPWFVCVESYVQIFPWWRTLPTLWPLPHSFWIGYIDGIGLFWCKGEKYFDLLLTAALYPLEWVQWSILSGLHVYPVDVMLELSYYILPSDTEMKWLLSMLTRTDQLIGYQIKDNDSCHQHSICES